MHIPYKYDEYYRVNLYIWCDHGQFLIEMTKTVDPLGYEFKVIEMNGGGYILETSKPKMTHLTNTIKDLNVYNPNIQYIGKCIIRKIIEYNRIKKINKIF